MPSLSADRRTLLRLQALEPYAIASADLSPDGAYIAIMASSQWSDNDMLFVWRVADGTLIAAQVISGQPAQFASFLPGTRTVLSPHRSSSSSADTALNMQIVQFAETGGQWTTLRAVPLQRPINMLGIAPDGKSLASMVIVRCRFGASIHCNRSNHLLLTVRFPLSCSYA